MNASIYISYGVSLLFWGWISDCVNRKHWLGKSTSRKLFQSMGLFGGALTIGIVPLVGCNIVLIIVLLNLSMLIVGSITGGENMIVVDVAPDFSSSIYAFTNSFASLSGFMAPLFAGILLDNFVNVSKNKL